jgi:hypothetical protein
VAVEHLLVLLLLASLVAVEQQAMLEIFVALLLITQ